VDVTARTDTWTGATGKRPGQDGDSPQAGGRADKGGRARTLVFGDAARPLRFALTGGIAGITQIALLALLTRHGWPGLPANGVAFLLAAQVNFALSSTFTWRDRVNGRGLSHRWRAFHGAIAGMAVVNMLVFAASRTVVPTFVASLLGIGVAAIGNFVVGNRLVFRGHAPARPSTRPTARTDDGRAHETAKTAV